MRGVCICPVLAKRIGRASSPARGHVRAGILEEAHESNDLDGRHDDRRRDRMVGGAFVGIMTAVSLSAVGSGVALFYAQRLANEYCRR